MREVDKLVDRILKRAFLDSNQEIAKWIDEYALRQREEGFDAGFNRARSILDPDNKKLQNT